MIVTYVDWIPPMVFLLGTLLFFAIRRSRRVVPEAIEQALTGDQDECEDVPVPREWEAFFYQKED